MNTMIPLSFEEYEQGLSANESMHSTGFQERTQYALSPLQSGKQSVISAQTRRKTLDYAHPIDGSLVKTLDNPAINAVLSKIVQTGIDANYSITLSTGIHITPKTNPDLYEIIEVCAKTLGMAVPYVVVTDSMRGLNACTCGTDQFSFIMISSLLPMILNRDELLFVIGHECGHLAMGHALYHTAGQLIGTAGAFLPVVGTLVAKTVSVPLNAWSRRSEITADRAGLICCGDLDVAKRALLKLEAGLYNTVGIDIDEYVRESEALLSNSTIGKLSEFSHSHPLIPKRIKALDIFAKSEVYAQAIGQPVAYDMLTREQLNSETEKTIGVLDNPINTIDKMKGDLF